MTIDDNAWIEARIVKTKTLIEGYEDGLLALATGAQTYSLDTGQTRQTVTKANVASMRDALGVLENRLATLEQRRYGCRSVHVRPGF